MSRGDAELVGLARAGDREAFATLIERHASLTRRTCTRVFGSTSGLDDTLQESALQAWLQLDSLRKPEGFGAWLTGIALNVARHALRRSTYDAYSLDALIGGRRVLEPIDIDPRPDEVVQQAELGAAVRAAVADLPRGQREAVLLVYLSGLSYRETAALLGVEVGAVKTRLHKGRSGLRRRLQEFWEDNRMAQSVEQAMVEMRVADVRRAASEDQPQPYRTIVLLEEVGGARQLPIWVGNWEGDSIALLLEKVTVPRPLTHAFTANLLRAGGVRVRDVRVHRLTGETFYAEVAIDSPTGETAVDARPSDSIALALEMGLPIYVAADILAAEERREKKEARASIGVREIVAEILERWPGPSKPAT